MPIKKEEYIRITLELLEAANSIHSKNLNLPDLCLGNIYLDKNDSIKLLKIG